MKANENREVL